MLEQSITAIVLAGGKSSRMGHDKALVKVKGVPLLQQIYTLASDCATEVYVITAWIERYRSILPSQCHFLSESSPGQGPLAAFTEALPCVKTDWVLLLACDLPLLTAIEVQQWSKNLLTLPEEIVAFLPYRDNRWEPLCGFYRQRCLPLLQNFITQGGRSFQDWLSQVSVQELKVSDPKLLFNCNTPEELNFVINDELTEKSNIVNSTEDEGY